MKKVRRMAFEDEGREGADEPFFLAAVTETLGEKPAIERAQDTVACGFNLPWLGGFVIVIEKAKDGGFAGLLGLTSSTDSVGNNGGNTFRCKRFVLGNADSEAVLVLFLGALFARLSDANLNITP